MLVAWDVRCLFRGHVWAQRLRRARSWRTAESTGGRGVNAARGRLQASIRRESSQFSRLVVYDPADSGALQDEICGSQV
jgi:hypothetical protein